jgi:hypothetical protein
MIYMCLSNVLNKANNKYYDLFNYYGHTRHNLPSKTLNRVYVGIDSFE